MSDNLNVNARWNDGFPVVVESERYSAPYRGSSVYIDRIATTISRETYQRPFVIYSPRQRCMLAQPHYSLAQNSVFVFTNLDTSAYSYTTNVLARTKLPVILPCIEYKELTLAGSIFCNIVECQGGSRVAVIKRTQSKIFLADRCFYCWKGKEISVLIPVVSLEPDSISNYNQIKTRLMANFQTRTNFEAYNALKKHADIKDERAKFF